MSFSQGKGGIFPPSGPGPPALFILAPDQKRLTLLTAPQARQELMRRILRCRRHFKIRAAFAALIPDRSFERESISMADAGRRNSPSRASSQTSYRSPSPCGKVSLTSLLVLCPPQTALPGLRRRAAFTSRFLICRRQIISIMSCRDRKCVSSRHSRCGLR